LASTSDGNGHDRALKTTTNEPSESAKFSYPLVAYVEIDIVHCELSMVGHQVQCELLSRVERAIEDRECADITAGLRESGLLSMQPEQQAEFDIAATTTPVRPFSLRNYVASMGKRRASKEERARVETDSAEAAVYKQQAYTAWRDGPPGGDANEEIQRTTGREYLNQAFAGAGYGAKISQVEGRRAAIAQSDDKWDRILNMSSGERRQLRREARMASSASEPKYLAFEAFEDPSSARSMV
jgi:hypothetical protein